MYSKLILFGASVLIAFLYSGRAFACGCEKPGPPCKAFGEASVVFIGTVKDVTEGARKQKPDGEVDFTPRRFKFSVEENFSGIATKEAEVGTGLGADDCGYPFVKGASYLVYAYRDEKDDRLHTSSCTRTKRVANAGEDLQYLRALASAPRTVTISGKVQRHLSYAGNYAQPYVPMEGALLSVEGGEQTKDVRTDVSGSFEVTGLKPGSLKLKLHLPDELTAYRSQRVLKFESGGCASEVFYVGDNGRISGRVLDAEGNPVSGLGVVMLPLTGWASNWYAKTDQEGRYKASSLPAGQYMVGINVRGLPRSVHSAELPRDFLCPNCFTIVSNLRADEQASPYPRMFYPGVFQTAKAERLLLSPGQELRDVDFRLPPRPGEGIVKGRVVRADGTPAAGAQVSYRDVTYEDLITIGYGVRANAQGEFSFKAYRGGRYVVEADYSAGDARQTLVLAEPRTVFVTKSEESITLVVNRFIK
ncbi:MAG TPA: carboxypeptidase regulatory-like domain-containing protein [Pyrinomonadaceae bacterium]|nr:carboxypeptidase regulatory-like domain-containing protein [Pyrinomonadaceae bacterium]